MACAGERRKTKKIGNSVSISRVLFLPNPYGQGSLLSFIYSASHPTALAFYPPPSHRSDGTPSNDGIHELAAPRSTDTCRRRQLLLSEVGFPMLPGLSSSTPMCGSDRTETLFPMDCKGTAIWQDHKIIDNLFFFSACLCL